LVSRLAIEVEGRISIIGKLERAKAIAGKWSAPAMFSERRWFWRCHGFRFTVAAAIEVVATQ
jgi:hypothetical protein